LIGMEACASAHFWANKLISMGHNVKLRPSVRQTLCQNHKPCWQTLKLFVEAVTDAPTCGSCRSNR
jgi:hypothetical protein